MGYQSEDNGDPNQREEGNVSVSSDSMALSPELDDALKSVDPQHREVLVHYIRQTNLSSFTGPLPPPEVLAGYDGIEKGFAERIIVLAEKQAEHRMACDKKLVYETADSSKRGQWFGFIIAILFLAGALALGFTGHEWLAGVIGGGTLISVVTVFLTNRPKKSEENDPSRQ